MDWAGNRLAARRNFLSADRRLAADLNARWEPLLGPLPPLVQALHLESRQASGGGATATGVLVARPGDERSSSSVALIERALFGEGRSWPRGPMGGG